MTQLKAVKEAGRKLTGHPITHAFYGINVPGYIAMDPVLQAIIRGSQRVAEETFTAEIPASRRQAQVVPSTRRSSWTRTAPPGVVRPEHDRLHTRSVHRLVGSHRGHLSRATVDSVANDMGAMLGNLQQVAGPFTYAQVTTNPVSLQHFAGDTFLPILKNPAAIFIVQVPTS